MTGGRREAPLFVARAAGPADRRRSLLGMDVGPGTRAVHAGLPPARNGEPLLPGPEPAAPYHLAGPAEASPYGYARYANRSWTRLEAAIGELEGGDALVFPSGMAAMSAVVMALRAGDVLVAPGDGYPGVRQLAARLASHGVEVRFVPTDTEAVAAACAGASLVWVETPSNPGLDVCDIRVVAGAARDAGAVLAVDNTLATPLGQRPLALGADLSMAAATKGLAGHSDLLLGYVATRDPERLEQLRGWRGETGSIVGPFEAWLAHRSLATADLRLERQSANSAAIAQLLRDRGDVRDVRHPSDHPVAREQMRRFGPLVSFTLASEAAAQRFLAACELVAEATSFGGVHTTAERRARWGTDAVAEGFVRLSAGVEETADLLADIARALDAVQ